MTTDLKNAEGFFNRLATDETFQRKFDSNHTSGEAILSWAKSEGYEFTEAEMRKVVDEKLAASGKAGNALSETELETINGGFAFLVPALGALAKYFVGGAVVGGTIALAGEIADRIEGNS